MDTATKAALISGGISFLFGGGLMAWFKFYHESKTENRSFAESEREKMRSEIERLNQSVSAMSARLIPSNLPLWIKDSNRKYIDINPAWEIQIGTRIGAYRSDVIGKTDSQVFHEFPDFAAIMNQLDDEAAASGGLAIRSGLIFPRSTDRRMIIKEIVTHDLLGQPVFKGMAIPE